MQGVEGVGDAAGVGLAGEGGDVDTLLVRDDDFGGGDAVMGADEAAFGDEDVPFAGGDVVVDGGVDGESEILALVHESGEDEVGQGEDGPALADASGVEVGGGHGHFGPGRAGGYFSEARSVVRGEAVACVQVFLECHDAGNDGFPNANIAILRQGIAGLRLVFCLFVSRNDYI